MATTETEAERANLATYFDELALGKLAQECVEAFEDDVSSRAPRMKQIRRINQMYALVAEKKSFPFANAANIKTPALTGPQLQIQARLMDMILPPNGRIMNVQAHSMEGYQAAITGERFSNHYIRERMPYFEQGMDDTLHQTTLYGSAFRRTYYDPREKSIRSDWIPLEDFVVAWGQRSQCPSLSDVPRYSWVYRLTGDELTEAGEGGYFVNVDKALAVTEAGSDKDPSDGLREAIQKTEGISPPDESTRNPKRQIVEQHTRIRFPASGDVPGLDGKFHYAVVTIDMWSEQILRIALREEDDPEDKLRYERDMQSMLQWQQDSANATAGLAVVPPTPAPFGAEEDGIPLPPEPPRKRQICFFTHYRCFPSDGFYGLGYGDILYGIAIAMNSILNQHIDGTSLTNAKPAFMSQQVRIPRGSQSVAPGQFIQVDGPISAIRDAIMFLDPPANDPTTVPLVQLLDGMKDSMVGSADVFSGEIPKSNQTRGGIEQLIEQAITPISVLGRRIRNSLRHELDKIWRCFGVFLPDEQKVTIWNEADMPEQMDVSRSIFSPAVKITPAADARPRKQQIEDHQALFGFVAQNPMLQQVPEAMMAMLRDLTEQGLRLFPGGERLVQYLPPPPPPPGQQGPPPPKQHWEEEAGWLRGEDSPVNPQDNDPEHIQGHSMFLQSIAGQQLDPTGAKMAQAHIRGHYAAQIEKGMQNGQQQQPGGPAMGPIGAPGPQDMAGPSGFGPPDSSLGGIPGAGPGEPPSGFPGGGP